MGIVALLILSVFTLGFTQERGGPGAHFNGGGPPPFGPGGPGGGLPMPFLRDLNLTDDQKAQVKQVMSTFDQNTKTYRDQLRASFESQADSLKDGAFDEATVRAAAEKRASIQVELDVARARMMSQVLAVLTPAQKENLATLKQQFEQKHKEWEAQHQHQDASQQ